jgi:hypothetical protein
MATDYDHVKFNDIGNGILVNVVPFLKMQFLPRVGEIFDLPGEAAWGTERLMLWAFTTRSPKNPKAMSRRQRNR